MLPLRQSRPYAARLHVPRPLVVWNMWKERYLAKNCKKLDMILLKKKFAIGTSLQFAGYIVSSDSVRPDPDRIEALHKFPAPNNVTGVRSFLGLAQQL